MIMEKRKESVTLSVRRKNGITMGMSVHEKAIRLIEGDIVEVGGISVLLHREPYIFDPCLCCDMDYLCHKGNEMCSVCEECDRITKNDCFLIPYEQSNKKS